MFKTGIVGKSRSKQYISAIEESNVLKFAGIFDPSFQFEAPKEIDEKNIYYSFSAIAKKVDILIFSSAEKIYLPLIEMALKNAKSVFLHGVYNLTIKEQKEILKLQDESRETVQINQALIFNEGYREGLKSCTNPLLWQFSFANSNEANLLIRLRSMIAVTLPKFKTHIRKITVNVMSVYSQMPDLYKVRIDFDNGSVAELTANNIEHDNENTVKCFEYNKVVEVKLPELSNNKQNLIIQLNNFAYNLTQLKTPVSSMNNEIITQQVIEKVKEKLKININFL